MVERRTIISLIVRQNKQNDRKLFATNSVDLKALKAKANNKSTEYWLKVWQDWALVRQYDDEIEIYPPEELDKVQQKFYAEVRGGCYFLMLIIHKFFKHH